MKTRFDVIQYLIDTFSYKSYLEIGVRLDESLMSVYKIRCEHRDGVDVEPGRGNYTMTSDNFFKIIPESQKYDIIFVDGDHEKSQVLKDIHNSLNHLNDNGCIVCHDINPPSESFLRPNRCHNAWEAWAQLRSTRDDLEMYALEIDLVGVIRKGSQKLYTSPIVNTWDYLSLNKKSLLNIITENEFKSIFHENNK